MATDSFTSTNSRTGDGLPVLRSTSKFEAVLRTFPQMLRDRAERDPDATAFCSWVDGAAQPTSWREYLTEVQEVTLGLHERGIVPGNRVAIMSSARREWVVAALAILSIGGVPVGVYPTSSVPEVAHVLKDSGAAAVFLENKADAAKVAAVASELAGLRVVIGFGSEPADLQTPVTTVQWDSLRAIGRALAVTQPALFPDLVEAGDIDQTAALFYTSGSTGLPKGVIHSHRTLQYSVVAFAMSYPDIGRFRHDLVGFLGLSHVAPALIGVFTPIMTRLVVTFCTMEQRTEALVGVRPTAILWPPRMHEKLASEVLQKVAESGRLFRYKYTAAMEVARRVAPLRWRSRAVPKYLRALYSVCVSRVFLPLRKEVGMDRVTVSWTASGSMTPEVAALWQMWGVDLRELYGTTETCGSVLAQWDRAFPEPGTIGKCIPDPRWSLRVSEGGELKVSGPCLFTSYWRNPEATASVMEDGWYSTGDLVEVNSAGEVKIIGRMKDVIKTSGGKAVSPQPIELRLKTSPLIDEAIVVGEGRKYLTVLLCVSGDARAITAPEREAALTAWIDEVNSELARPLQLKKFRVLPRALSADDGELTAKATVRRAGVLASFSDLIDDMYDANEHLEIARQVRLPKTTTGRREPR